MRTYVQPVALPLLSTRIKTPRRRASDLDARVCVTIGDMNFFRSNINSSDPSNSRSANRPITRRSAVKALGTAAATAIIAPTALSLAGCGGRLPRGGHPTDYYVSPYDWNGLVENGQRLDFYENGTVRSRWGIDVSEHQFDINWPAVATAGVEFAFIRIGNRGATEGRIGVDDYFLQNAIGAAEQGIAVSGYFFSQALNEQEVAEEVAFTLEQVAQAEKMGCSFEAIAYDHERVNVEGARANDISGEQLTRNAAAFCDEMLMAGYNTLIYGNKRDLLRLEYNTLTSYPIWFAEYDVNEPTAPFDFVIWQYTNSGAIPGISTRVDLNMWLV